MKSGTSSIAKRADRRGRTLLARFAASRDGATAVEFSIIALPFFFLLFSILELGMVFMVSSTLDNATDAAARRIRTGEVQLAGGTAAAFKTAICGRMTALSNCASKLSIDVRTFDQFADVTIADPAMDPKNFDAKGKFKMPDTFEHGGANDIVLVRTYYQWGLITPLLGDALKSLPNGDRLISATATFRNEPYEQ